MFDNKKQFEMFGKSFCAAPAPLLWKGLFFIIPLLTLGLFILIARVLFGIYKNKRDGKKLLNKKIKIQLLYLLVIFLSLVTYGLIGLDFNYYLLLFFLISFFVLGAFFLGEHFKLVKIRRELWIGVTAAAIFFALWFVVCFISSIRESKHIGNEPNMSCLNRAIL